MTEDKELKRFDDLSDILTPEPPKPIEPLTDLLTPDDRQEAINWAAALLADPTALYILDTETTGLNRDDEIIELALLRGDGEVIINSLIYPSANCYIENAATDKHGLTLPELIDGGGGWSAIYAILLTTVLDKKLVIYNAEFDLKMLRQTCIRQNVKHRYKDTSHAECAMLRYAAYYGQWHDYFGNYKYQKLPNSQHRALGDCRATLELIKAMANGTAKRLSIAGEPTPEPNNLEDITF
jgi:DNA polymerase III subunit epsilon